MSNQKRNITIVGGQGQMGLMLTHFFNKLSDWQISSFLAEDWQSTDKLENLKKQDLVLLSVPIHATNHVIQKITPYLGEHTTLADITSIKKQPVEQMMNCHKGPVLGLHPVFGPSISQPDKQVIVYYPACQTAQFQWFLNGLAKLNFQLEYMATEEHDHLMNFIQGIEHFSVYCLGVFLKQKNVDINQLLKLASPVYKMELNIVGRLLSQSPTLYSDIIMADKQRTDEIAQFAQLIQKESANIQNQDHHHFIDQFQKASEWLGEFTEKAYKESDDILNK